MLKNILENWTKYIKMKNEFKVAHLYSEKQDEDLLKDYNEFEIIIMATIGEVISRVRGQVKAEVQDAFVTDRYVYSLIVKYAQVLMRRQDFANKLMKFNAVWKVLPYIELIEVDKVEAYIVQEYKVVVLLKEVKIDFLK